MKILHLPLKAKWYEMIECGTKLEEYREIKPYWSKRFLKDCPVYQRILLDMSMILNHFSVFKGKELHRVYTHVKFSYGYTKRTMTFEIESITIGNGKSEWGAPAEDVFIIKLGKRVY